MLHKRYIDRHGAGMVMAAFDLVAMLLVTILFQAWVLPTAAFVATVFIVYYGKGLYRSRASLSVLDDFPRLFGGAAIGAAFGFALALDVIDSLSFRTLGLFGSYLLVICFGRMLSYFIVHRLRSRGLLQRRVAIVGTGLVADQLVAAALADPKSGFNVVGYVDDPANVAVMHPHLRPVIGAPHDINDIIIEHDIDYVIVAFSALRESELVGMIRTADRRSCEISMVERFFEVTSRRPGVDEISGIPLVLLQRRAYRSVQWRVKRLLDIVVAGVALVLLSPILLAVAIGARIDGGPGIIFRQQRISLDGDPFEIMKFRSLRPANEAESATKWNVKNDARMSKFGKFIRKTSIDELPQLFNILNGDMSLVGPRPERPHFVEEFGAEYRHYDDRHRVPSGLTGWAQVNGLRGDTSIEERARYDNYYIQNWSLWLDIKIMMRTTLSLTKAAG
ncbi:MAG: sugar transferase [Candidatus Nanopelagicales bacterium]